MHDLSLEFNAWHGHVCEMPGIDVAVATASEPRLLFQAAVNKFRRGINISQAAVGLDSFCASGLPG